MQWLFCKQPMLRNNLVLCQVLSMKTNYCYRTVYLLSLMTILMATPGIPLMATPAQKPLYLGYNSPPLMLLTMQRDHRLFYEAYNDLSDLNGDGTIETRYKPNLVDSTGSPIDYYGYFDSHKCYMHDGNRFVPGSVTINKRCSSGSYRWSGDFLNYLTMTRMDTLRKVLYGGKRSTDNYNSSNPANSLTVLERAYIPQDVHVFGKEYDPALDTYNIADYTPLPAIAVSASPASQQHHLFANVSLLSEGTTAAPRLLIRTNQTDHIWDWIAGKDKTPLADWTWAYNLIVRVQVCMPGTAGELREANCKGYPLGGTASVYKPTGILHDYGENNSMYFGLLTGSYTHNLRGGVLRRKISSFQDEINTTTGQFKHLLTSPTFKGIVATIDAIKINGFDGDYNRTTPFCSDIEHRARAPYDGECTWWGNPVAEMMYEGLRYFAGAGSPTSEFNYTDGGSEDNLLGLPLVTTWGNPYNANNWCAKPFQTVISDVMPTFDSDNLPGSLFAGPLSSSLSSLDVASLGQYIWNQEYGSGSTKNIFIGEVTPGVADLAPSPKSVSSFSNIRGLAQEDTNKQGSYYAAAVAAFGKTTDLNSAQGEQKVDTFAVALSSTAPKIEIPVTVSGVNQKVTIVPFAKLLRYSGTVYATPQNGGALRMFLISTDTSLNGGRPYYKFLIEYGSHEFSNDNDMDALVIYEVKLNADNTIDVFTTIDRADGAGLQSMGALLHFGYVISGTTNDGVKLLVRNESDSTTDVMYANDGATLVPITPPTTPAVVCDPYYGTTPPTVPTTLPTTLPDPPFLPSAVDNRRGHCDWTWFTVNNMTGAISTTSKTSFTNSLPRRRLVRYTPGTTTSGEFIQHDPLWYAAKWGGFLDGYDPSIDAVVPSWRNNALNDGEWEKRKDDGTIITPNEPRNYFPVTNAGTLARVLDKAFEMAVEQTSSSSAAATNSGYARTPDKIYQAKFSPRYWFGQLIAYKIDPTTGNIDTSTSGVVFDAANVMPAESARKIYSYRPVDDYSDPTTPTVLDKPKGGFEFKWTEFSVAEKIFLNPTCPTGTCTTDDQQAALYYLRGQRNWTGCSLPSCQNRSEASGAFRKRNADVNPADNDDPILGDIINSAPVYVGDEDLGYGVASDLSSYADFVTFMTTRGKMLYAGANDGMLHAFDAETGVEKFAYIPRAVFSGIGANKLSDLTRKNFPHQYYVDGPVAVGDACFANPCSSKDDWKSILVGTLGAGGKAVYALDVTDPASFSKSTVLWEFTHPELGYVTGQPLITRLNDGNWYAVIGNGYESFTCDQTTSPRYSIDSTTGLPTCTGATLDVRNAKLFLIKLNPDLSDGWDEGEDYFIIHATDDQIEPATHTESTDNALAMPGGLTQIKGMTGDINGDFKTDLLYAGDMQGHLWRFDLQGSPPSGWTARSFFQAKDDASPAVAQAISAPPAVMRHPSGGYIVLFGTGRYIYGDATYVDDPAKRQTQTFYGIWDNTSTADPTWLVTGRSQLQQQTITAESTATFGSFTYAIRNVSNNSCNWGSIKGWYLDLLQPPSSTKQGERVTEAALFTGGDRVIFNTKIPSTDACTNGGSSWLMEIDAICGRRTTAKTFDLNKDREVNSEDQFNFGASSGDEKVNVSGIQRRQELPGPPGSPPVSASCGMTTLGEPYCDGGKKVIVKTLSCTDGSLLTENDAVVDSSFCGAGYRRTSWRELQ